MATSFLALLTLLIAGAGLYHRFNCLINLKLVPTVEIGAGFFIASVLVSFALGISTISISLSSDLIFGSCVAISSLLLFRYRTYSRSVVRLLVETSLSSRLNMILMAMMSVYFLLTLTNNLSRDILPWDAFTTWMYRAKVWVMNDSPLDFVSLDQWLRTNHAGYTLAAAHYPISVSAMAAFSSSLTGGWDDQAASLPWLFAYIASALIMIGLCKIQNPDSSNIPVLGGALLISVPLVHIHSLLAGYADIWVMGTSGMGLAGICIWTRQRSKDILYLSLGLLALGCFWKTEGWLWLLVGIATMATHRLWELLGIRLLFICCLLIMLGGLFQPLSLGTLGTWGVDAGGIRLGALGEIGVIPYNPATDYLKMAFTRGNFLLIAPFYLVAFLWILISNRWCFSGYLLMGLFIAICHSMIFGLSEYSKFAQSGTAINRLLLQTLPVCIITITAVLPSKGLFSETAFGERALAGKAKSGLVPTLSATTLALLCLAALLSLTAGSGSTKRDSGFYAASNLQPILGKLVEGPHGHQFVGADLPMGVASAPIDPSAPSQPRYIVTRTWMATPETIAFYWVNADSSRVHSTPIFLSGSFVIDMANYPEFWQKPIKEMGYLVPPESFSTTALGSLSITNSLIEATPAVLNHWLTPEPLSQRLINMTMSHFAAPITLQSWLSLSFLAISVLGVLQKFFLSRQHGRATNMVFCAAGVLWLIGSAAHFNQAFSLTATALNEPHTAFNGVSPDGSHLREVSALIADSQARVDQPVLIVSLDKQMRFDAERLPFMLLPLRASSITEAQLAEIEPTLEGTLLLIGQDKKRLNDLARQSIVSSGHRVIHQGNGYTVLSMGHK